MKTICTLLLLFALAHSLFGQMDDKTLIHPKKLREDLTTFKQIREKANSGLYVYRTKVEVNRLYAWAFNRIKKTMTVIEFYKIIAMLTDFEGSCHNLTLLPKDINDSLNAKSIFFPYPIKVVNNKLLIDIKDKELPLGAEILSINGVKVEAIKRALFKYINTDGYNRTGKADFLSLYFSKHLNIEYGWHDKFLVKYKEPFSNKLIIKTILAVDRKTYLENTEAFHSKRLEDTGSNKEKYDFRILDDQTALLTIRSFAIGTGENDPEFKKYIEFLDKNFNLLREKHIKNLIIDIRNNRGGNESDVHTFQFLANAKFKASKKETLNFIKVPLKEYVIFDDVDGLKMLEDSLSEGLSLQPKGNYTLDEKYTPYFNPKSNSFKGQIYLLINPRVASSASLFAALVRGNTNAIVIGEETKGGYYRHNGNISITYQLPNTKIKTTFSIVDIEQFVSKKKNQPFGRGIMPDHEIKQTPADFIANKDSQMEFVLKLVSR